MTPATKPVTRLTDAYERGHGQLRPFRVCAVVFTANGEQVGCYDVLLPWPRATKGLSSMEAHADPFEKATPVWSHKDTEGDWLGWAIYDHVTQATQNLCHKSK